MAGCDIEVNVGRTGKPIGALRTGTAGGTTVAGFYIIKTRLTGWMRIGDTVVVRKAAEIIPEIIRWYQKTAGRHPAV